MAMGRRPRTISPPIPRSAPLLVETSKARAPPVVRATAPPTTRARATRRRFLSRGLGRSRAPRPRWRARKSRRNPQRSRQGQGQFGQTTRRRKAGRAERRGPGYDRPDTRGVDVSQEHGSAPHGEHHQAHREEPHFSHGRPPGRPRLGGQFRANDLQVGRRAQKGHRPTAENLPPGAPGHPGEAIENHHGARAVDDREADHAQGQRNDECQGDPSPDGGRALPERRQEFQLPSLSSERAGPFYIDQDSDWGIAEWWSRADRIRPSRSPSSTPSTFPTSRSVR